PQAAAAKPIVVQQKLLSRIMDELSVATVNFLKIDCEGSEYEVLRSLDAAHWARIERIAIEYHDFGRGRDHRELIEILRKNGFETGVVTKIVDRWTIPGGARMGMLGQRTPRRSKSKLKKRLFHALNHVERQLMSRVRLCQLPPVDGPPRLSHARVGRR